MLIVFIYCFTAQVLKVCRTPGSTACSMRLEGVFEKLEERKNNSMTSLEPANHQS